MFSRALYTQDKVREIHFVLSTHVLTHQMLGLIFILYTDFARQCLRQAIKECQQRFPFEDVAWVLLDDHLHTIWILPDGDSNFSGRWAFKIRLFPLCNDNLKFLNYTFAYEYHTEY